MNQTDRIRATVRRLQDDADRMSPPLEDGTRTNRLIHSGIETFYERPPFMYMGRPNSAPRCVRTGSSPSCSSSTSSPIVLTEPSDAAIAAVAARCRPEEESEEASW